MRLSNVQSSSGLQRLLCAVLQLLAREQWSFGLLVSSRNRRLRRCCPHSDVHAVRSRSVVAAQCGPLRSDMAATTAPTR